MGIKLAGAQALDGGMAIGSLSSDNGFIDIDIVLEEDGTKAIPVTNAHQKKIYALEFNTTVGDLSYPERYNEEDTAYIRIRSSASPLGGAGLRVNGLYK